jgi:hypothetical protein
MQQLREQLQAAGVDTASLRVFHDAAGESIHALHVPGWSAIQTWVELRESLATAGYWPVLLGEPAAAEEVREHLHRDQHSAPSLVEQALALDVARWFEEAEGGHPLPRGAWPGEDLGSTSFTIPYDARTRRPHREVVLALVPALAGWQAVLRLGFGGFNRCPPACVHGAVLRFWEERLGAELVGLQPNILELWAAELPPDRNAALALAREQYLYCRDIVEGGCETLDELAAILSSGEHWYFWWERA